MTARPLDDNILVVQLKPEKQTASGIILTEDVSTDTKQGVVYTVGPNVVAVKKGDTVIPDWTKSKPVNIDGYQMVIISEKDVLAVID